MLLDLKWSRTLLLRCHTLYKTAASQSTPTRIQVASILLFLIASSYSLIQPWDAKGCSSCIHVLLLVTQTLRLAYHCLLNNSLHHIACQWDNNSHHVAQNQPSLMMQGWISELPMGSCPLHFTLDPLHLGFLMYCGRGLLPRLPRKIELKFQNSNEVLKKGNRCELKKINSFDSWFFEFVSKEILNSALMIFLDLKRRRLISELAPQIRGFSSIQVVFLHSDGMICKSNGQAMPHQLCCQTSRILLISSSCSSSSSHTDSRLIFEQISKSTRGSLRSWLLAQMHDFLGGSWLISVPAVSSSLIDSYSLIGRLSGHEIGWHCCLAHLNQTWHAWHMFIDCPNDHDTTNAAIEVPVHRLHHCRFAARCFKQCQVLMTWAGTGRTLHCFLTELKKDWQKFIWCKETLDDAGLCKMTILYTRSPFHAVQ